jgi:PAS domain S-box-containing protein
MASSPVQTSGMLVLHMPTADLSEILSLSSDALLLVSWPAGCIREVNEAFCLLTGCTREELLGRSIETLEVWLKQAGWTQLLAAVQAQGGVRAWEAEFNDKAGRQGAGLVSAQFVDDDGETCLLALTREMTPQRLIEEQLRASLAEQRAHTADLEAFAHTVAHDLKGPLSNISGYVEWLLENEDAAPTERRDFLHVISRNAGKMRNIINELLLLAQARQAEVELHPLDTNSLVSEALARLAYLVSERRVTLSMPGTWPQALGYGPWVEEIWVNYLSNAIKYGGSRPQVELGSNVLPNGHVRFWVRDNGPGLAAEAQAHLFTAFGEKSKVRATGSGLGLSIVKQIAEKMGGQVGVESTPGQGCLFFFTLPAE